MLKHSLNLVNLLETDINKIAKLIELIKKKDKDAINNQENVKTNQDLIDQMNAYKARSNDEITQAQSSIDDCNGAISAYQSSIDALNTAIAAYEAQIEDLETQIVNDDLIIAYIPPDLLKK